MGFGFFLSLKVKRIPTRLGLYLVQRFNTENCSMKLETFDLYIYEENINLMLRIPYGPKQVEMLGMSKDSSDNYIGFLDWMKKYGSLLPEKLALLNIILKNVEVKDDFKRDIVI